MFRNIELSIYDKNDKMNTIGSSSDELVLGIEQFAKLAHVKPKDVLKKLGIKEKSGYAIGVWSRDADNESLRQHFWRYTQPRQAMLNWSELFRIFPETSKVDWYKIVQSYHKKRIKFLGSWVNKTKLFIIRNDHPEDLDLLKPYIDDYTVVLTWKELLLKLNTDLNKKFERSKHPYLLDVDYGYDIKWDNGCKHLVFPDNTNMDCPIIDRLRQNEDDTVETWTGFLNFFPEAAVINWDQKDLPIRDSFVL